MKTMLLAKLKTFWGVALAVCVGAGVVGMTYRAAQARQPRSPTAAQPKAEDVPRAVRSVQDELEELRLEVAALRKGLQATRERVKALERAVGTPRTGGRAPSGPPLGGGPVGTAFGDFNRFNRSAPKGPGDPLAEAEAALKQLRKNPTDKRAADALERALQQLKERMKSAPPGPRR
jgi:hypothetical protein